MAKCSLITPLVMEMTPTVTIEAFLSHNDLVVSRFTLPNVEYPILISREYPILFQELRLRCDPNVNPLHCLMTVNIIKKALDTRD